MRATKITKKKKDLPIGVFDSGVGGLSVLRELQRAMPRESFVYLADQAYVPYGEKSKKELIHRALKIGHFLVEKHRAKMIAVACNTATCYTIDALRRDFEIPIVGTVPAVRPAAGNSKSGFAVISTPATARSPMLKELIKKFAGKLPVQNIACKGLENIVEEGKSKNSKAKILIQNYLNKLNPKTDYLVLGCTHYPFLKEEIQKVVGKKIKIIDSGKAIARQTKKMLPQKSKQQKAKTIYYTTGKPQKFSRVASLLLGKKVKGIQVAI